MLHPPQFGSKIPAYAPSPPPEAPSIHCGTAKPVAVSISVVGKNITGGYVGELGTLSAPWSGGVVVDAGMVEGDCAPIGNSSAVIVTFSSSSSSTLITRTVM